MKQLPQSIAALSFDLDETLLNGSQFGLSIEKTCHKLVEQMPEMNALELREANSRIFKIYGPESIENWTLGRLTGNELSLEAWRRTLAEFGLADQLLVQYASETHLRFARQTYILFDDARKLLDAVRRVKIPTALITNGASDTQRIKLEALNIHRLFDAVVISGETGLSKPDPAVFAVATEQLGITGNNVWHVGDNPDTDVVGAQQAGLTGVWVNRRGKQVPDGVRPDLVVDSLAALINYLPE